ncbi:Uncharacterized protein Fot_41505 [Forsythia ovata]|uniref:Uncharacterized protein n=1 Tax=Forsythia ovata TaxID=205694 RepID=A0ABD1RK83_9LAMI
MTSYEYELRQDNHIIPQRLKRPDTGDSVYINFRIDYILKKRSGEGDDETLESIRKSFWSPSEYFTGPEIFFHRFLRNHGVSDDDVREGLIRQVEDFVNRMNVKFPMVVSIRVYTVQKDDEAIDVAKDRAITGEKLGHCNIVSPHQLLLVGEERDENNNITSITI